MLTSDSWESCCLSHCSSAGIAGPSHHHSKFHRPLLDGSGHDTEFICCSDLFVTRHNMLRVLFCERVRVHHRERKTGDCVLSPGIRPCPALAQPVSRRAGAKGTGIPGLIGTEAHCSLSAQQACLLVPLLTPHPQGTALGLLSCLKAKTFQPVGSSQRRGARTWRNCFSHSQFCMNSGGPGIMGLHGPRTCSLLSPASTPHSSSTCPYPSPVLGMVMCCAGLSGWWDWVGPVPYRGVG